MTANPGKTLVLVEHDGARLKRASLNAITLAKSFGGTYALLVIGCNVAEIVKSVGSFGASLVLVADDAALAEPLADRWATVVAGAARKLGAATVVGTTSTFTKDVLPRVAALLDAAMLTDVTAMEIKDGAVLFQRSVNAGSQCVTVRLDGEIRVLTVRAAAFHPPDPVGTMSEIEPLVVEGAALPQGTRFVSRTVPVTTRPDLSEARVVVSGGRPLKDKETFERLIGGLADALGGAVGATRAAVDSGMAANDCQVGQTGREVAPELYIAVGISGALQHTAGIKDSRVIVAINRDGNAPIFQVSTYGLVGDLHEVVPQLIAALRPDK